MRMVREVDFPCGLAKISTHCSMVVGNSGAFYYSKTSITVLTVSTVTGGGGLGGEGGGGGGGAAAMLELEEAGVDGESKDH